MKVVVARLVVVVSVVVFTAALLAQDATEIGQEAVAAVSFPRVLAQADSLKVVSHDEFPKDLSTEIQIGSQPFPNFSTEGRNGMLQSATINVNAGTRITVLRQEGDGSVLMMFSQDSQGKVFALFDLDLDGQWDVKKTPTKPEKNFIWQNGNWKSVDMAIGITSKEPTATVGHEHYKFHHGWARIGG
jgi:hypothetical protein